MKHGDFAIGLTAAAATALAAVLITLLFGTAVWHRVAHGENYGQWAAQNEAINKWYRELMQPDYPEVSCCGFADAYHADSFEVDGDKYVAIITDTREDGPLSRRHIEPGTKIPVPNHKLKFDAGNPTGHGVIFVQWQQAGWYVLCYVVPGGV
jgi:hypothetical protein